MSTSTPSRALIAAAFIAVYFVWGSTYLAIRVALETLPPFTTAAVRFIIAGALLFAVARAQGVALPTRREWSSALLVGGLLLLGGNGGVMWAEAGERVPSGLASVLIATVPIFVVLFEALLARGQERPTAGMIAGVFIGFGGVALLVGGGPGPEGIDPLGAAALLSSAFSWSLGTVASRRVGLPASPVLSTACQMLAGGALLAVASLVRGEWRGLDSAAVSGRSLLAVAYLIVFGSIVAFSAYVWLLRVVAPTRVATYAYVNPIVALLLGYLLASEPLGPRTLAAAGLTVLGVGAIVTARGRARALPAPATAAPCRAAP